MKRFFTIFFVLAIVAALIGGGVYAGQLYLEESRRPKWREQSVEQGSLNLVVNATGKVQPVHRVAVGASVSGPISELMVDYNSEVVAGQLMARIDPRIYDAAVQRDRAILRTRQSEVERANALLQQAKNDEKRAMELRRANPDFISETELDQSRFNRLVRQAEHTIAASNVEQAQAQLDNSETNLAFTYIRAPVAGIVIDRKVDVGQTLAAQFQTPEMFVVAPEMSKRMHIYASVDEADIGLIRKAKDSDQPVRFTVDAYPDELFENGKIMQVRLSSKEEQNVITYPVIVETPNDNLQLLPGMTANLSFQIESREDVLKIPNAALRFYPDMKYVHPDDKKILEGTNSVEGNGADLKKQSATDKVDASRNRSRRHVWVQEDKFLRARSVVLGISDSRYTEMLSGDVKKDELLVIGIQPK